jgi:hypothetical protein
MPSLKWRSCWVCLWGSLSLGCSASEITPPVETPPVQERPVWHKGLQKTDALPFAQKARNLRVVRGIIHLHSVYSHDACDGDPQPGGKPNAPCLQRLRRALCATRMDFALLTDHATHMAEAEFDKLVLTDAAAGDVAEHASGEPGASVVGSDLRCDDAVAPGQRVHIAVGGENELMPVALRRHLGDTEQQRKDAMHAESPAAIDAFHQAGGAVLVAHGESRSIESFRRLAPGLDGMEVYNLHANIDPKIREQFLGLDGFGAIAGLSPWLVGTPVEQGGPEPDLAFLGFLLPNRPQLEKFDTLLAEGHKLLPMLGSDIHENAFKQELSDGDRGDSYRRLMRWFGNHLLVPPGPLSTATLRDAVVRGRGYGVFHVFGEPVGFDFWAVAAIGPGPPTTYELGDSAPLGATLHVLAPRPFTAQAGGSEPSLRISLRYIALGSPGGGMSEVVATRFVSAVELEAGVTLKFDSGARAAGAYRVEVSVVPRHLSLLLGDDPRPYMKEYPYLYSAPIYVK